MNELIPFKFENSSVRTVLIEGEPWWVASDVAVALGYKKPCRAYERHAKGSPKWSPLLTTGGPQNVRIINEGDVFRLIAHCTLEEGQHFEKWLFETVLPQIRKTGGYNAAPTGEVKALQSERDTYKRLWLEARHTISRYENRLFMTLDDKAEILMLLVNKYPISHIQRITKKGASSIKKFREEVCAMSDEELETFFNMLKAHRQAKQEANTPAPAHLKNKAIQEDNNGKA